MSDKIYYASRDAEELAEARARIELLCVALRKARRSIVFERDCVFEGVSLKDGTIPDEQDANDVAAIDELIDEIDAALGDAG